MKAEAEKKEENQDEHNSFLRSNLIVSRAEASAG